MDKANYRDDDSQSSDFFNDLPNPILKHAHEEDKESKAGNKNIGYDSLITFCRKNRN